MLCVTKQPAQPDQGRPDCKREMTDDNAKREGRKEQGIGRTMSLVAGGIRNVCR